jgi:NodT family efflux transporter outer membrane factor (OMF) lipoprotein
LPSREEPASWWQVFQDRTLSGLVEAAVSSNLDLMLAEARIRQARAARGAVSSALGPAVDATGSFRRSRSPQSSSGDRIIEARDPVSNQYQVGFDAAWELDFFGGVRRSVEAAEADLQAAVEARRDVLVTLTAEVARGYIDLRTFEQRIGIARQNLAAQQHSVRLTLQRFEAGFVSYLDVANAQAQAASTAAQIPLLEGAARQIVYSLGVLVGREPGALLNELSPASEIPHGPPSVPVGVPSDLLRRRPDIRQAETEIHAATARVGVAVADLFPRFDITGSFGFQAGSLGSWLDPASRFWSLAVPVSWRIFDTGRIRANIEVQKALEEQSVIRYRQVVLASLQEVENALIASAKEEEHRKALVDSVTASRKAVDLAIRIYTEGQTDFLNVLQAQRALYASEDALVQSTGTVSTNLVSLYKALGGGWEVPTLSITLSPTGHF